MLQARRNEDLHDEVARAGEEKHAPFARSVGETEGYAGDEGEGEGADNSALDGEVVYGD